MSAYEHKTENTKASSVQNAVFDRIEREHVTPRTKNWFRCREAFFFALVLLAILIGALSVAETYFRLLFIGYDYYEVTHGSLGAYALDALPLLWVFVLASALLIGHFNIRHTKKGYRYPLSLIMLISIVASVLLGALFYRVGLAHIMDARMAAWMPFQTPLIALQERLWSEPESGRLVGVIDGYDLVEDIATVMSPDGTVISVDTSEVMGEDRYLIAAGEKVRFVGIPDEDGVFHACHAMPFSTEIQKRTYADVRAARLAFRDRLTGEEPHPGRYLAREDGDGRAAKEQSRALSMAEMQDEDVTESMMVRAVPVSDDSDDMADVGAQGNDEEAFGTMMALEAPDAAAPEDVVSGDAKTSMMQRESNEPIVRSTFCGGVRPTAKELKKVIEERGGLPLPLR